MLGKYHKILLQLIFESTFKAGCEHKIYNPSGLRWDSFLGTNNISEVSLFIYKMEITKLLTLLVDLCKDESMDIDSFVW